MSLTATTLSAAIGASDTTISVASATGITAPNFTSGVGITYLFIEQEVLLVLGVSGTFISVQRGYNGTFTAAHGVTTPVLSGLPADFAGLSVGIKAQQDGLPDFGYTMSAPVASAATITASGPFFHLTGTTTVNTINLPAGFLGGFIVVVFDGACGMGTSGNVAVAITGTSMAGKAVLFAYDPNTSKWYPTTIA
jgi:hypothetical protein